MKVEMANLDGERIHDLLGSSITPLPVFLISTVGEDGIHNAAPFSLITPVCWKPPIICASFGLRQGQKKDTTRNIEFSKDFVVNLMDETLIKPTFQAAVDYPSSVDEIKEVGLTAIPADKVKSPRIAESQISLECRLVQSLELGEGENFRSVIFGEVVLMHVRDELWAADRIQVSQLRAVGRLGLEWFCKTGEIFEMRPPKV